MPTAIPTWMLYAIVIVVWSTTPLAVKTSSEGSHFVIGISLRMWLGAVLAVVILRLMKLKLPLHREALLTYFSGMLGFFIAMLLVYWAAQYVASGLISVMYGTSPIIVGSMGAIFLKEPYRRVQLFGGLIGIAGMAVIFQRELSLPDGSELALIAILGSALFYGFSMMGLKTWGHNIHPMAQTTGGLCFTAIACGLFWLIGFPEVGVDAIANMTTRAAGATVYLGIFGSVLGFVAFFTLVTRVPVANATIVTLATPVLALLIGNQLNDETIYSSTIWGALLILFGLALHELYPKWRK